ncbi:MAG: tRNA (guanine(10)-N(2))-dimethyltransferase [Candidatus Kariarchaeaceae archaeon]|jgi:tRNA (guanine26-N2/guanine27-N2)-dimethyltransferase
MSLPKISEENYILINEGPVKFWVPKRKNVEHEGEFIREEVPKKSDEVFYNEKQVFNRDLSILILNTWEQMGNTIDMLLEPLCASGIRALRYLKQGPKIGSILCNDINPYAINLAKHNTKENFDKTPPQLNFNCLDARKLFVNEFISNSWFNVIDIDPFGSPQPYVNDSIKILGNPGLFLVTATDMPVWVGNFPLKAYRKYGITHLKLINKSYCHEIALRALISYVQREFMKHNQKVLPLISISIDHYMRIAFHKQRGKITEIISNNGFISDCLKCKKRSSVSLKTGSNTNKLLVCSCGSTENQIIGPVWLGPLHDNTFLSKINDIANSSKKEDFPTIKRIKKYVTANIEENKINFPWFYDLHWIAKQIKKSLPSTEQIVNLLRKKGFDTSITHFSGTGIKTNAQYDELVIILSEIS